MRTLEVGGGGRDGENLVPPSVGDDPPTDTLDTFHLLHSPAVRDPTNEDVIRPLLGVDPLGPRSGSRLHHDDAADTLSSPVRLRHEKIEERAQEVPGAELQDGFW